MYFLFKILYFLINFYNNSVYMHCNVYYRSGSVQLSKENKPIDISIKAFKSKTAKRVHLEFQTLATCHTFLLSVQNYLLVSVCHLSE